MNTLSSLTAKLSQLSYTTIKPLLYVPFALALLTTACSSTASNASTWAKKLNTQVVMLPVQVDGKSIELETTIYKPAGNGPFPLLLLNHGKNPVKPRDQPRSQHLQIAAVFVNRGFVVAIPMREGFAHSGGNYPNNGCDVYHHAFAEAKDSAAALADLIKLPYVDKSRIVIAGQSDGGLISMALSTQPLPGVLGVINFSGGLRMKTCDGWQQNLVNAYSRIGAQARYPSLWFYGDNDQLWPLPLPQQMFNAYRDNTQGAAINAHKIDIGSFGNNSHDFADSKAGIKLWYPKVKVFMQRLGLPFEPI